MLSWSGVEVTILQGNHDYLRRGHTYFQFLNHLPGVTFVTTIQELADDGKGPAAILLPHTKTPSVDWEGMDFTHFDMAFMHQTVRGAKASNGQAMDGEHVPTLDVRKVWSGDIHVPQTMGNVEYVGSPYHVHFGDKFKARCVLLDRRGRPVDVHFETLHRVALTVRSLDELKAADWLRAHDQIKLTMEVAESELHEWRVLKREALAMLKDRKVDVHGLDMRVVGKRARVQGAMQAPGRALAALPDDARVLAFVESNELGGDALDVGLSVLS